MRRAFWAVWVLACLLVGFSAAAWGQQDLMAEQTSAEQLLAQGDQAFQGRDYTQAARSHLTRDQ